MGIEIDLFLERGSELTWFCVAIENELVLVFGSKLVYVGGRTWLDFSVGIEIDLVLVWGVEIDLVLV